METNTSARYKLSMQYAASGYTVLSVKSSKKGARAYLSTSRVAFSCMSETHHPVDGDQEILAVIIGAITRLYGNVPVMAMTFTLIVCKLGFDFGLFREELSKDLAEAGFNFEFAEP